MPEAGPLYVRGDPTSPVAVCTLSSQELLRQLAASPIIDQVAIVGPLETENLGVERMFRSLLSLRHIRWLVVCGDETRQRRQGQAVRALFQNGVGAEGEILGARGPRARLPTLRSPEVNQVRRQVTLRDLIGISDLDRVAATVAECLEQQLDPVEQASPVVEDRVEVPPGAFRLRELDPEGFFLILIDRPAHRLVVEHYGDEGVLRHRLAGEDADSLSQAIVEWGLVSRMDHAAYLGRELARAEAALRFGFRYRQDEGLQPPDPNHAPAGKANS